MGITEITGKDAIEVSPDAWHQKVSAEWVNKAVCKRAHEDLTRDLKEAKHKIMRLCEFNNIGSRALFDSMSEGRGSLVRQHWYVAIERLNLQLSLETAEITFRFIDVSGDGYIDVHQWSRW